MRKLLLSSALILALAPLGCNRGKEMTTQAAREPATAMTDNDLEQQIQTRLNTVPDLKEAGLSISADADHNRATLSGTVTTEAMRTKALELARSANPGIVIEDRIDVKPPELSRSDYKEENAQEERARAKQNNETLGGSLDDAWIHAKVVSKLIGYTRTSERHINVDVMNNVVTLRGTVSSPAEKQEAGRVATDTDGVKRVNNQLKIQG